MSGARRAWLLGMIVAAGCGDSGAVPGLPDAGPVSDGQGPGCAMSMTFSPDEPRAPGTIVATASIERYGSASGLETYEWSVVFDMSQPVAFDPSQPDQRAISFGVDMAGVYGVELHGSVGETSCTSTSLDVSVTRTDANMATYRLRMVPLPEQPAPPQERAVVVYGGADMTLGTLSLDPGIVARGMVQSTSGQGVAAYLRAVPVSGVPPAKEEFSGTSGLFDFRLLPGGYDVLVVPADDAWAPLGLGNVGPSGLASVTVTSGQAVSGVVLDSGGAPLQGARVSLRVDGVPSTLATTGTDGSFVVRGRAAGSAALTVVPPPGSGLPVVDLAGDAGLVLGAGSLDIGYAADLGAESVATSVRAGDGVTPLAGARVTWMATLPDAAVIRSGALAVNAPGQVRHSALADQSGQTAAILLPRATDDVTRYDVIVEPAPGDDAAEHAMLDRIELGVDTPGIVSMTLAPPARITGTVMGTSQAGELVPVAGVEVRAVARGVLARAGARGSRAMTSAGGAFELAVTGGGSYELGLRSRDSQWAHAWLEVTAPLPGQTLELGAITLPRAILLRGQVVIPGLAGGAAGVHVAIFCYECGDTEAQRPVAEAVTAPGGEFVLAVPDPGVGGAWQKQGLRSNDHP